MKLDNIRLSREGGGELQVNDEWTIDFKEWWKSRDGSRKCYPKFETTTPAFSLKSVLQACGVQTAFLPGADYSGLADEDLALEEVRQKCFVKVDEEGTKAAAVTGFGYGMGAPGPRPKPKVITFDRPFLWVIGDLSTPAAPWFMGLCEEP